MRVSRRALGLLLEGVVGFGGYPLLRLIVFLGFGFGVYEVLRGLRGFAG